MPHRLRIGALVPSQNTVVEPELAAMAPPGTAIHAARMKTARVSFADPDAPARMIRQVMGEVEPALDRLMDCRPDVVILAMGAPCFEGGPAGTAALRERLEAVAGVPVVLPPEAVAAALAALGPIRRVGLVSPYMPAIDEAVVAWLEEAGIAARAAELTAAGSESIAAITPAEIVAAIRSVDGPDVDAIVQFGTTMGFAPLVAGAELWLGKPVVAVNAACLWQALRRAGIRDRIDGFGRLLGEC